MIIYSTPGSITWGKDGERRIKFQGEWSLEPKFYLDLPATVYWEGTRRRLAEDELRESLNSLLADANEKGWVIEICRKGG